MASIKRVSISAIQNSGIRKIMEMKRKSTLIANMADVRESAEENALASDPFLEDFSCEVEKVEVQPCRVYKFTCSGQNSKKDSTLNGRNLEWKATFDLPIEEFAYPSLQRYQYDALEDRTEVRNVVKHHLLSAIMRKYQMFLYFRSDIL